MENILRSLGYAHKVDTFLKRGYDADRFLKFVDTDLKEYITKDTGLSEGQIM